MVHTYINTCHETLAALQSLQGTYVVKGSFCGPKSFMERLRERLLNVDGVVKCSELGFLVWKLVGKGVTNAT